MDVVAVTALCLTGVSTLLLIVLLVQLRSLGIAVSRLVSAQPEGTTNARRADSLRQNVTSELEDIGLQIQKFDLVFSDMQRQLTTLVNHARIAPREGVRDDADSAPAQTFISSPETSERSSFATENAEPTTATTLTTSPDGVTSAPPFAQTGVEDSGAWSDSSPGALRLQQLVADYRNLITQPQKNEINRWSADAGGWTCEVSDDGTLQPLARDAGGLLVLVPHNEEVGALLPGGRLVVDFPTSFANVMSMRRVTRQSFELINDGSGVLRLLEPAWAKRVGDKWQVVRMGKLAGLNSD